MKRQWLIVIALFATVVSVVIVLAGAPANLAHIQATHALATENPNQRISLDSAMPYFRGLVDQKTGDLQKAEAEFTQALQTRHEPFAGAHLVEIWQTQGRYAEILAFLQTGQRLEEGFAHNLIASSLLKVPATESQRWLEVVKARYPGALLRASQELVRANRYDEAAVWSDAVNDSSQKYEALLVRGISDFYRGNLKHSEVAFSRAYQDRQTADTSYWYGRVLTLNGQPQTAVPILEESVRQASSGLLPWALRELGSAYALAGRCDDAKAAFQRSVQSDRSVENQQRIEQAITDAKRTCIGL